MKQCERKDLKTKYIWKTEIMVHLFLRGMRLGLHKKKMKGNLLRYQKNPWCQCILSAMCSSGPHITKNDVAEPKNAEQQVKSEI